VHTKSICSSFNKKFSSIYLAVYYFKNIYLQVNKILLDMEALSVKDYRNKLAASFARADNGEDVFIRRKNQIYALINVGKEELIITPELQKRIDEARKAYRDGKCVSCRTKEELHSFLDSL
jgi:antitoxin (DNA-binding transcriptional repressor) of toxin-antitoxin stability system